MLPQHPSRLAAYTSAVLLVPLAIVLTGGYGYLLGQFTPAFFYLAVCLSSRFGGAYPGLTTGSLSLLAMGSAFSRESSLVQTVFQLGIDGAVMLLLNGLIAKWIGDQFNLDQHSALQESEAQYRAVVEDQTELIIRFLPDGTILFVNQAYCDYFGLQREELIGRSYAPIVFEADREMVDQRVKSISPDNPIVTIQNRVVVNGEVRWTEWISRLLPSQQGEATELQAVGRDITQLKEIEEALRISETRLKLALSDRQTAEERLRNLSDRLALALNSGAIGTWDWDLIHDVCWDDRMYELYGLQDLGRAAKYEDWINTLHPDDREQAEEGLQAALRGEGEFNTEFRIFHPDGTLRYIRAFALVQRNGEGEPQHMVGINYDITDRKQAEHFLTCYAQEIEDLYNNAPCGYHSLDAEGCYIRVNETELKLLGYSREEMLGKPLTDFFTAASRQSFAENYQLFQTQGWIKNQEYDMVCKDGTILPVMISAIALKDENGHYLYNRATLVDVRDRKQAEEQLRLSAERISLANAELSRAARLKDEFLAGMSHELRTPLNAILGMSEVLLEEIYGHLTPEQQESVALIERSGQHLLALINDILDLAKVESGKMDLELSPVQLQQLCDTSLSFVKQQAYQKHIHLVCTMETEIHEVQMDERRMGQVLINLLSNAVKFTPEGGRVQLSVRSHPEQETIEFAIADTGIGIAPEQLGKLFQPFVQLDSSLSRRYTGTGLGLALVRRLVELHGGSIAVESAVGQGSCFKVILPQLRQVASPPMEAPTLPASPSPAQPIHHALIIEDSESAANQVSRYLTELGTTAVVHPMGRGVIDLALQAKPDVIILDILLPDLPGWEVLMELKAHPRTRTIPVLIISVVDERAKGLALGASDYLLKPIARSQLQQALNRLTGVVEKKPPTALVVATYQPVAAPLIVLAEDNEANIEVTLNYLHAYGLRTAIARNGLEAVQLVKQGHPDLVLMDIQMPEMDGLEAIRQIRADRDLASLPIIALTALAMPGDQERCLAAGATEYFTKPVQLKQLLRTIRQYLPDWPITPPGRQADKP